MARPVHFEIHAADPERAAAFYRAVFGWEIKKWDNPAMEYWMVMTGQDAPGEKYPGIDGGLLRRKGGAPAEGAAVNAFVNTITVESADDTIAKVLANGGSIALPKNEMKGLGWLAYCKDTEGNIFGILQPAPEAQ